MGCGPRLTFAAASLAVRPRPSLPAAEPSCGPNLICQHGKLELSTDRLNQDDLISRQSNHSAAGCAWLRALGASSSVSVGARPRITPAVWLFKKWPPFSRCTRRQPPSNHRRVLDPLSL